MSIQRSALRRCRSWPSRPRFVINVIPIPAIITNVAAKRVDSGPIHGSKKRLIEDSPTEPPSTIR